MIPAGILTGIVHMDAPVSFVGAPGRLHVSITPSASLIWAETATPLTSFIDNISLPPGAELRVELPQTDQDGFLDNYGNSYKNWYYTIKVIYEKDGQRRPFPEKTFQLLAGQDEVDLALIPVGGPAPLPMIAPSAFVTSVGGFAGAVTTAQLGIDEVRAIAEEALMLAREGGGGTDGGSTQYVDGGVP